MALRTIIALATVSIVATAGGVAPAVADQATIAESSAPTSVVVDAPALIAEVSWGAAADPAVLGYRVDVHALDSGELTRSLEVPASELTATVPRLPRWVEQVAQVTALYADGAEERSAWSAPFRVLSTLTMADSSPIVRHGDGACCDTYQIFRRFNLDAPMPIDVWVRPTVLEFDGNDAHDGFERTDDRWPAAVNDFAIRIPAGSTSGRYEIYWSGDEWKRFEYAHWTFGFEPWIHPADGGGAVHLDRARQDFTMYEDDPHFWPDVRVDPTTAVDAGETARVRVRLDVRVARTTVLDYRLKDGTARAGRHYTRTGGSVTVHRGQHVVWVRVPTTERRRGAGTTTFSVRLTGARHDLARVTKHSTSQVRILG